MKMFLGNTPMKNLNIRHYEISTNDCDMVASDLQAGKTAVARGQKITGTGKCFSFASYGSWITNESNFIPMNINMVQISSADYPVKTKLLIADAFLYDFATPQEVAEVIVDGIAYPMTVSVQNGEFLVACEKDINIEFFIGKDEYV